MINVAILGCGVVGSGVAELLLRNAQSIESKAGSQVYLKYILEPRDLPDSLYSGRIVKDFGIIRNDPSVSVVVETIGGIDPAYRFTKEALLAGKSVITSNKELVAYHGAELLNLAEERNLNYLFEASVGGGIPVIRPLNQCLTANDIEEISGILNGTTNYILTRMIVGGLSFEAALDEAKSLGYAERDPTADIEGHDACRKICILSSLAFGRHIFPKEVLTRGITQVTSADVRFASSGEYSIKLLARAIRRGDSIYAYVAPHLVHKSELISGVVDVFNAIKIRGDAAGDIIFYGRGAGKFPTASAVVADIIDAAKHLGTRRRICWSPASGNTLSDIRELPLRRYIRACGERSAASIFGNVEPLTDEKAKSNEFAFVTQAIDGYDFETKLSMFRDNAEVLGSMFVYHSE